MKSSKIEWTEKTWNPITGCSKYSSGCKHCYAEVMANRLKAMGKPKYANGFNLTLHRECLNEPLHWREPHTVFVCSMSDIFHDSIPFEFTDEIIDVIKRTPQHQYQILTKRAERMYQYFSFREIPSNVWLGVTVECKSSMERIDYLRNLPATVKFLSCEPLLEDLGGIVLTGIDWIIVGGESGYNARPMNEEWVLNIKTQAKGCNVPFFFKQWGTWGPDGVKRNKAINGKLLQGEIFQEMPKTNNSITIQYETQLF